MVGMGGGPGPGPGVQAAQRNPQHREREIIWSGELEWQEKVEYQLSDIQNLQADFLSY